MSVKYTYLIIDIGAVLVPFIFSFHKKIQFHNQWKALWTAIAITTFFFVLWDMYYTRLGVWGFNERYLTGIKIAMLPVEEVLFFICIPYSSMFTYYCFQKFKLNSGWLNYTWIPLLLSTTLLVTALFFYDKLYTCPTFIALASLTVFVSLVKRTSWLSHFYLMFLVILVPFFIVNGLLTGTGLEEPVVWYNDNENMNIRLLTIPVEDLFYGMLLLLINTLLFELFRKKDAH
jgi:lycopene cyclase domain-containing protein